MTVERGEVPYNPFRCPVCGSEERILLEIVPGSRGPVWRLLCNFCRYEEEVSETDLDARALQPADGTRPHS